MIYENLQEMFDVVYKGLKTQRFQQSVATHSTDCLYRSPNGDKCAIGYLIPDDKYDSEFEYSSVKAYIMDTFLDIDNIDFSRTLLFLQDLQRAHDTGKTPEDMKLNLEYVARVWYLKIPV